MPVFLHNGKLHAFVHVPKCGGTTVERALKARFGELGMLHDTYYATPPPRRWSKTSPQHITWLDMAPLIPEAMLDKVFAVVRHPLSRFVSTYNFNARTGHVPAGMGPEEWFEMGTGTPDKLPFLSDNHLKRQIDLMPERATVFRLEDGMQAVTDWIDTTFGVKADGQISDGNVAPSPAEFEYRVIDMPSTLKRRIEQYYSADYERFGYGSEPAQAPLLTIPRAHRRTLVSRMHAKLWARRIEHRFRRIESSVLMAVTRAQSRHSNSRVS